MLLFRDKVFIEIEKKKDAIELRGCMIEYLEQPRHHHPPSASHVETYLLVAVSGGSIVVKMLTNLSNKN